MVVEGETTFLSRIPATRLRETADWLMPANFLRSSSYAAGPESFPPPRLVRGVDSRASRSVDRRDVNCERTFSEPVVRDFRKIVFGTTDNFWNSTMLVECMIFSCSGSVRGRDAKLEALVATFKIQSRMACSFASSAGVIPKFRSFCNCVSSSSVHFRGAMIVLPPFRIDMMLSFADSTFVAAGFLLPLQNVVRSTVIAHCTAPSKTARGRGGFIVAKRLCSSILRTSDRSR